METFKRVKSVLRDALSLGERAERLTPDSALLGAVPEFDSMAVVAVVTMLEEELGIAFSDDELSAETFATVRSLVDLVDAKLSQ
jgi:acyl carrier protein